MERLILMGRIAAAHGLKGLVKLQSFTGEPAAIGRYGPLRDATGQRRFEITVQNLVKGGVVARIAGVADRTAADKLRGIEANLTSHQHVYPSDTFFQNVASLANLHITWGTALPTAIGGGSYGYERPGGKSRFL